MASNKEHCLSYLRKYAEKDLQAIDGMFADDIILRDWKIRVIGKQEALRETKKNFDAVSSLQIDVLHLHESDNSVIAELKITVDRSEILFVVDILSFDDDGKINSIRAYLGRGND